MIWVLETCFTKALTFFPMKWSQFFKKCVLLSLQPLKLSQFLKLSLQLLRSYHLKILHMSNLDNGNPYTGKYAFILNLSCFFSYTSFICVYVYQYVFSGVVGETCEVCLTVWLIYIYMIYQLFWFCRWNTSALGVNTKPPDALSPKVARAPAV